MSLRRVAALVMGACVLLPAVPAAAAPDVERQPAAASAAADDSTPHETINMTFDWNAGYAKIPSLTGQYWGDHQAIEAATHGFYAVVPDPDGGMLVSLLWRPEETYPTWLAPTSFEFYATKSNLDGSINDLKRVVVTVVNVPRAPSVDDIELPTATDASTDEDLAALWDCGSPIMNPSGEPEDACRAKPRRTLISVSNRTLLHLPTYLNDSPDLTVKPLNSEMAKYFTATASRAMEIALTTRKGSPRLPYSYWTQPWFRVDYSFSGKVPHPNPDVPLTRPYSIDRTVRFAKPAYRVTYQRLIGPKARLGFTRSVNSWSYGFPVYDHYGSSDMGAVSGSWRVEMKPLSAAVKKHLTVKLRSPAVARGGGVKIGISPRTKAALKKTFTITWRVSAMDRTGTRIWSPWTKIPVKADRR